MTIGWPRSPLSDSVAGVDVGMGVDAELGGASNVGPSDSPPRLTRESESEMEEEEEARQAREEEEEEEAEAAAVGKKSSIRDSFFSWMRKKERKRDTGEVESGG